MRVTRRSLFARSCFVAAVLVGVVGCREPDDRTPADRTGNACVATSTHASRTHVAAARNLDSLRRHIDSLDRRVARASDADLPALLLARGRAKSAFQPAAHSPQAAYVKAHPSEFHRNGGEGEWLYDGADFQTLIRRFPASELADDAGYAISLLPMDQRGECEDFSCDINREWSSLSYFLNAFPASPLTDSAADRTLAAFLPYDSLADPRASEPSYDPRDFRALLTSLDSTGRKLGGRARARLLTRAGVLWERAADYAKARSAYTAALVGADSASARCPAAHLAEIPAHPFVLEPARAINTHRVELRWERVNPGPGGFRILRSQGRRAPETEVAQVEATAQSWTDRTARSGVTYWYRVVAAGPMGDSLRSNRTGATTITDTFDALGVAVSVSDHSLYLFGSLSNLYPQVVAVSADGKRIVQSDGMRIGSTESGIRAHAFDPYVDDLWLAGTDGRGVFHFRRGSDPLPPKLLDRIRVGSDLVRAEFAREAGRAIDDPADGMNELLVSVDDRAGTAWVSRWGGGGSPIAMDCVAAQSLCWIEYETRIELQTDKGAVIASANMPSGIGGHAGGTDEGIYADGRDSSAWIALCAAQHAVDAGCTDEPAQLVHVDLHGIVRHIVQITDHAYAPSVGFSADRDAGIIWFTRVIPGSGWELGRVDVRSANPEPRVVARGVPGGIASDLDGGVWVIRRHSVQRLDREGRTVVSVSLKG